MHEAKPVECTKSDMVRVLDEYYRDNWRLVTVTQILPGGEWFVLVFERNSTTAKPCSD